MGSLHNLLERSEYHENHSEAFGHQEDQDARGLHDLQEAQQLPLMALAPS